MALCRSREGPGIISPRTISDVGEDSVKLPDGYSWDHVSLEESDTNISLTCIKDFLDDNYIADSDGKFRLQYTVDFIRDFLEQGHPKWNAAVTHDKIIVGFIAATRRKIYIKGKIVQTVEVNLLCVHSDVRHKRLAEYLIQEITRRVELQGIFTAIYTSGQPLPPKAFNTARYYHKFLDVVRLNAVGYTEFADEDIPKAIEYHQHKKCRKLLNPMEAYILRPFLENDVVVVKKLFENELGDHVVQEMFDEDKLNHMLRASYLDNYIVEEVSVMKKIRTVVGFISVYNMDLTVLEKGDMLATSYIYTYCGNILPCISDLFTLLQKQGKTVVNSLDIGKNKVITRTYNMLPGTGYLYYYMYNYRMPLLPSEEVAYMVL